MASTDTPAFFEAQHATPGNGLSFASPQPQGSDLSSTLLLNSAEQALAFAQAHLDQMKSHLAQYRSMNGL